MRIEFHPDVYKQLQQLPPNVLASALRAILDLADEPRPHGAVKMAGSPADWRVRIGQYRIIYSIDERQGLLTVMRVAKRSDAYR